MNQEKKGTDTDLKIVGIGASASGLQALEAFFSNCPEDSGLSFVVIQHLSPDFKSMHATLLARKTNIPVSVVQESTEIEPNHIYLIPETKNIILSAQKFELLDRPSPHGLNLPIDLFFSSLAKERGAKAVGVILSGSGSDGTQGAAAIKEAGGIVFAQNPEESGFPGMPLSVIHAGLADFVLDVHQVPAELISYFNYSDTLEKEEVERIVDDILEIIKTETKYDFTVYRRQTLKRRILKRKNINKLDRLVTYKDFLEKNEKEQDILANEFLIGVTQFFRDAAHFKTLEQKVIPEIIAGKGKGETIKIWVIGCVTGEEAYSLAILLKEGLKNTQRELDFKIFATDIDHKAIEKASKGHFGQEIVADVASDYLSRYFRREDNGFSIQSHLRRHIVFSHHDILKDPPFNKMDLISCRNLLIYFQDPAQEITLSNILYALNVNGYLFLGASESLGTFSRYFEVIDHRGKIFRKKAEFDGVNTSFDVFSPRMERLPSKKLPEFASELTVQLAKKLALVTNSVCICVNENFQILEVYGSLRLIGSLPFEGFSTNLLKLLPKEFHVPVATAIRTLSQSSKISKAITKTTEYTLDDKTCVAKIIFDRFDQRAYPHEKFYIIAISVTEPPAGQIAKSVVVDSETTASIEIQELRTLLEEANENLQLTIEELESSNEEAQATNEELVSSNEELQSTNEELQSVNEELYTVNAELQEKNIRLLELNADIENLINNSPIASLFLDDQLRIRRFTPSLRNIFELWESDIGRPITSFSLPDRHFLNNVKSVIDTGHTLRKKILIDNDKWYLQEIHAYVTSDAKSKGAVINYIDITDLHEASRKIEESELLNSILELSPANFLIYDLESQKIVFFNHSFGEFLGYTPEEIHMMEDSVITRLFHPDDVASMLLHYESMKKAGENDVMERQMRFVTKDKRTIQMKSVDRPFELNADGSVKSILSFLTAETTQEKSGEIDAVRAAVNRLNEELKDSDQAAVRESLKTINDALEKMK